MTTRHSESVWPLAEFVAGLRPGDLPPRLVDKARLQLGSAVAAALGGRLDPGVRKVLTSVKSRGGAGAARLLSTGERVDLHAAVVGNAAASCAFDWDEILLLGHPSHSAVNVSLALGSKLGRSLGEVLTAQVAADEVGGRFGLACFFGPQNGQHLPFLHHVGAAAAASRLLELDTERTAHALAIALAQPQTALWPAFLGSIESKVLTAAHPAEIGLSAAEHAASGMRGPLDILDHPRGFFSRFSFLPARAALGGLGRAWLTDTLQVKRHAACWYFQAPLDAAERIRDRVGALRSRDIRELECDATFLATAVHGMAGGQGESPLLPNVVNFRLDLSLALLLAEGRLTPGELTPENLAAREVDLRQIARVTRVAHDPALSRDTVATLHRAVNVTGLLGDAGVLDVARALDRGRREFRGLRGPGRGELGALLRSGLGALRALAADREPGYDLGDHAAAIERLSLRCAGRVTLTLADGTRVTETARVPRGALQDLAAGRAEVTEKLARALALAGVHDATDATDAFLGSPLELDTEAFLEALLGAVPSEPGGHAT